MASILSRPQFVKQLRHPLPSKSQHFRHWRRVWHWPSTFWPGNSAHDISSPHWFYLCQIRSEFIKWALSHKAYTVCVRHTERWTGRQWCISLYFDSNFKFETKYFKKIRLDISILKNQNVQKCSFLNVSEYKMCLASDMLNKSYVL